MSATTVGYYIIWVLIFKSNRIGSCMSGIPYEREASYDAAELSLRFSAMSSAASVNHTSKRRADGDRVYASPAWP